MANEPEVEIDRGLEHVGGQVRVWSTIGVKVPVPGLDWTMAEFSFGHERWSKNSTQEELHRTARLVDEFNSAYVDKHLRKLLRDIRRLDSEVSADTGVESSKKSKKDKKKKGSITPSSVMDRAKSRMRDSQ